MKYYIIVFLSGYAAGSVPFAFIIAKLNGAIDIRKYGSGNPGAANTLRVLGRKAAATVLLLDFFKGYLPVLIVSEIFKTNNINISLLMITAGLSVILGHIFPVWLKFRGGKGVASAAGVFTALYPPLFPVSLLIFILSVLIIKKISAASIITALSVPISYCLIILILKKTYDPFIGFFTLMIPAIIVFRHRSNIKRIIKGIEPDISEKRSSN